MVFDWELPYWIFVTRRPSRPHLTRIKVILIGEPGFTDVYGFLFRMSLRLRLPAEYIPLQANVHSLVVLQ